MTPLYVVALVAAGLSGVLMIVGHAPLWAFGVVIAAWSVGCLVANEIILELRRR